MEANIKSESQNSIPYYTPSQIMGASFLGSPLAACWFISRNFLYLEDEVSKKKWIYFGILASIGLLIVVYFLPEKFPNNIIPLAYTMGFFQFAKQLDVKISERRKLLPESQKGSTWKVVGVSLLFLVVIVLVFMGAYMLFQPESTVEVPSATV